MTQFGGISEAEIEAAVVAVREVSASGGVIVSWEEIACAALEAAAKVRGETPGRWVSDREFWEYAGKTPVGVHARTDVLAAEPSLSGHGQPAPGDGWQPIETAVKEWNMARLALCAAKKDTPQCTAAFVRLGQAEDALQQIAAALPARPLPKPPR